MAAGASSIPLFRLNNGVEIPAIGLGCWSGLTQEEREAGVLWMKNALEIGYKHFDTAAAYFTEPILARAIEQSGVKRENVFVTTKLASEQWTDVQGAFNKSLKDLKTDYVDLYLVHWPQAYVVDSDGVAVKNPEGDVIAADTPTFVEVWAEVEKIYASGRAKAVGVSNFSPKNLDILLQAAKIVPAVNQVELHPYLAQPDLKKYCDEKGILLTAYTPTGYSTVRSDPVINALAKKYNVQPAQIILAWHIQRGVSAVPKSSSAVHQKENLELPALSPEDFNTVSGLDRHERLCNKANERGTVWGWTYDQLGW